jgi:hypothetical protein
MHMTLSAYWSWGRIRNAGDDMMPYVTGSVFGRGAVRVSLSDLHILGIGSILAHANERSLVWGSGMRNKYDKTAVARPEQIRAVRGKSTADILTREGLLKHDVPLGDPGIFAEEIASHYGLRRTADGKRICVVPHYYFASHPFFQKLWQSNEVAVLEPFDNSLRFFQTILDADVVISQSLHGLIIAEALGKPNLWIAIDNDENWDFKFYDWFSTTLAPKTTPVSFRDADWSRDLTSFVSQATIKSSAIDKARLRAAFPTDPGVSPSREYFDFRLLRRLLPLSADIAAGQAPGALYEEIPKPWLDELGRQAMAALRNTFQAFPERGYCLIFTPQFTKNINDRQRTVICNIMDRDSPSDYVNIIDRRDAPDSVKSDEYGHGVFITANERLFGSAFCVRADFNGFGESFRTLII